MTDSNRSNKRIIFSKVKERLNKFSELGIFLSLIALSLVIGFTNSAFFGVDNLMNIIRTSSYIVIIGVGQTLVLILGGFDLSVGSVMGLGGLVSAACMNMLGLGIGLSITLGILAGGAIGLLNGTLVVRAKMPPFIVTLGTLYIARGLVNVITRGRNVFPLADGFEKLGNGELLGIPFSVIIMVFLLVASTYMLKKTTFGRKIMAIGGNEHTARLSGINIGFIKQIIFVITGMLAAFAGIIITSRMGTGQTNLGTGWELTVVAACIIGGTSTFGGKGSMFGTLIGALIMSVLTNGMVLMRISTYYQNILLGAIIIVAVGLDLYNRRKTGDIV
jgi:ribose/xylose/arabinose/galactoside ABC-type transport system permease subunit